VYGPPLAIGPFQLLPNQVLDRPLKSLPKPLRPRRERRGRCGGGEDPAIRRGSGARSEKLRGFGGPVDQAGSQALDLTPSDPAERVDRRAQRLHSFFWQAGKRLKCEPTRHLHLDQSLDAALAEMISIDKPEGFVRLAPLNLRGRKCLRHGHRPLVLTSLSSREVAFVELDRHKALHVLSVGLIAQTRLHARPFPRSADDRSSPRRGYANVVTNGVSQPRRRE
jgi:hypothetical protein